MLSSSHSRPSESNRRQPFVGDLIPIILASNDHWWTQDLLRLAQVSSSWLFYVKKRLYSCPSIHTFSACALLARSLQENPHLLLLVSGIVLKPMLANADESLSPNHTSGVRYLLGLDSLTRVTLGGQLARGAERFLNSLANPAIISELVIDGGSLGESLNSQASVEWDESMFYRLPNLKKLRLANLELDICPSPTSCHISINHLILDNVDISSGYLCQMINGAAIDFLGIYTKAGYEYDEQLRLALESCTVKCLHYEITGNLPSRGSFLDDDVSDRLPFRCLHLKGMQIDSGMLTYLGQQCQNLVELVITGREVPITVQEWEGFISSGALSSLERLGLPWGTHFPPFTKWPPSDIQIIQTASAARRLQLLV